MKGLGLEILTLDASEKGGLADNTLDMVGDDWDHGLNTSCCLGMEGLEGVDVDALLEDENILVFCLNW